MKTALLSLIILLTGLSHIYAQRVCGSVFNPAEARQKDNARYQRFLQLENVITSYKNALAAGGEGARVIDPNGTITIPVVVHVIHAPGEAVGAGRNISVAQVQSQIDVLNEDFRRLNADRFNTPGAFAGAAADPNIEFRLACMDPNGNPTNGITRTASGTSAFTDNNNIKFNATGGHDAWPTSRYLNIWVGNLAGGLLGYAQFPFDYAASPNTDGVVITTTSFGRVGNVAWPFDEGRTATHEVGHWLNLFHIWGDAQCGNDQCGDTPPQFQENYNCPGFPHTSGCTGNAPNGDMFMNYMDYTNDACMNLFTNNQRARMRAVFAAGGPRAGFVNNYFYINYIPSPICSSASLSVFNPTCLPVTWSVVSGPATISGAGNAATIIRAGDGLAVIRASAGNYVSEITLEIGVLPTMFVNFENAVGGFGYWCSTHSGNLFTVEPSSSNVSYEARLLRYPSMTLYASNPFAQPGSDPFGYAPQGWYVFQLKTTNACGTSDWYETEVEYADCLGQGGGGESGGFRVQVSPNPSYGDLNVRIEYDKRNSKRLPENGKVVYAIYDLQRAQLIRQWTRNNDEQQKLDVRGIQPGQYILHVTKGKYKRSAHIVIK
jgi:hypothetical protein